MDGEIQAKLKAIVEKLDDLLNVIRGNGHDGLLIRVDRIEQKEERRGDLTLRMDRLERRATFLSRLCWTMGTGACLAIITALTTIFIK